jgi:SAM-dependent methyltransferase
MRIREVHENTRITYNKIADKYQELFWNEMEEKPFDRQYLDAFLASLDKGSVIYDAGCGPGHITRYIFDKGYHIVGIDISEKCIQIAAKENPAIPFECADFLDWQITPNSVDAIISFYSIIYTPKKDINQIIEVFYNALKPNGKILLVLKEGAFEGYQDQILGIQVKSYFCEYRLEEIREILQHNYFNVHSSEIRAPYEHEINNNRIYIICSKPWNYHQKKFKALNNSSNGEVSSDTIFSYFQSGDLIWGDYQGGAIRKGSLMGLCNRAGELEFAYQHVNDKNEVLTGKCISKPSITEQGKIQLHEQWEWTCKDFSKGSSILEEI